MAAVKFHWRREWFSWFVKKLRGIHIPSRHRQVFSFHLLCLIIKQLISYHWRCLSLLASSQHVLLTQLNVKNADNWDESGRKWEVVPESFQRRPPAPGVCASCLVPWAPLGSQDRGWPRGRNTVLVTMFPCSVSFRPAELEPAAKGHIGGVIGRRREKSLSSAADLATALWKGGRGWAGGEKSFLLNW